ncbi:MAG: alpha/beta hydrolase [Granulosicoccus sp.]
MLVYIGLGGYLYFMQRSFIYFPSPVTPAHFNTRAFHNEGEVIQTLVLNGGAGRAILYFGGNAENVSLNAQGFTHLFKDYSVYLVNYRGYGGSSGNPSEDGLYSDALSIYDEMIKAHDSVSVIGRSLGSAVATHVASQRAVDRLVLITPFDSIQNIAQEQFPMYPMELMLKDKHDSYSRVKTIRSDTLILVAQNDTVVEMHHTRRLIAGFDTPVLVQVIEGRGHNTISNSQRYVEALDAFL